MKFEELKFEKGSEPEEQDKKEGEQKLERFLGEIGEKLRKEGIPVDNDCRINMEAFSSVYSGREIERDRGVMRRHKREWKEEPMGRNRKEYGEKLEALKVAIFHKFLGKDFFIVRSSPYDDFQNKIDNVILEKKTGNVVCAFDEVGDMSGSTYEAKKAKVFKRDVKEKGGNLKYGLKLEKDEKNQMKLALEEVTQIPILYLALDKSHIEGGVKNLIPSFEEKSEYEEKLWKYFTASLNAQIQYLDIEPQLEPNLKNHLEHFQKAIQKEE